MKTAVVLITLALVGYVWCCGSDGDCSRTECCLNQDMLIASKRQLESLQPFLRGGTCHRKGGKGESCAAFFTCGKCQDGLQCVLDNPRSSILQKRRVAYIAATCLPAGN